MRWLVLLSILFGEPEVGYRAPRGTPADAQVSSYQLPPNLAERAESFAFARHVEGVVGLLYTLLVLIAMVRLRVGARLQAIAERVARKRFVQTLVFAALFVALFTALELPTAIVSHALSLSYGLSVQSWGSFAVDWLIGLAISVIIGTIVLTILYALLRKSPRRWWLWTWLALLPLLVFMLFVQPLVIDPLFNKFEPLADKHPALVAKIQALAAKSGEDISADHMFVMVASEKSNEVNAYVTGIGASKRVVLWDTTLEAMTDREIAFVVGHELGHYVLHHMWIFLGLSAVVLLVGLWISARVLGWTIRRWGERWQIASAQDFASFPLLALIFFVGMNVVQPIACVYSRAKEHEADAFGLRAIEGTVEEPKQAAAHAFVRLGEVDLEQPDPGAFWVYWQYTHPPLRDRVQFVLE